MFESLPVRRIEERSSDPAPREQWPATIPAVRQLLDEGLDLGALTVFVGDNGAGKSTILEAVAEAYGLEPGGGTHNSRYRPDPSESPLAQHLQLVRSVGPRTGVFLRAETMHQQFTYLSEIGVAGQHNFQSHGESFIEYFSHRAGIGGLWIFDEAESALSFSGCLTLLMHIRDLLSQGAQVIISTHSPLLAALPEARIYECGPWGLRRSDYDDIELVRSWRLFLEAPSRYLRHLFDD